MIFKIYSQLTRHPLTKFFHFSNFLQMSNDHRMVDAEFFGNFLCRCKRISFSNALGWLVSTSDGQPLAPHLQGLVSSYRLNVCVSKIHVGLPDGSVVNNPPANVGVSRDVRVQFLGWKDPLEKEMAPHSSVLAWRIPGTGEPGGLPSMGSHRVGHD